MTRYDKFSLNSENDCHMFTSFDCDIVKVYKNLFITFPKLADAADMAPPMLGNPLSLPREKIVILHGFGL